MAGKLEGKVALVTGGASGIGEATAITMAKEGARVVVADIATEGGEAVVKKIVASGGQAKFIRTDVTQAKDLQAAVNCAVSSYGRLDIGFNNAGMMANSSLIADDAEQIYDRVMAVNAKSVMLGMKYEIAQMLKQGSGVIVNTSSAMGLVATGTGRWAYTASKHAVLGLTKSAAAEFASQGIRINAICPGGVATPMVADMAAALAANPEMAKTYMAFLPIGRICEAQEVADVAVWLASDASSYVVGTAIPVDGGYTAI